MSFGGAGQGNIRYSIILDDTQAIQKIGQFKTALNGITQPSQALATNIGTLNTNFGAISTGLTTTNTGFKTLGTGISGLATPTQTLNTNMGVLNNNFKTLNTTEAQTVTQTNAFKTGITALTTPTATVNTNMKGLVGTMGPLAGNFQKTTGAARDMVVQQKDLTKSSVSLGDKIKGNVDKFAGFATGMATVATGVIGLVRNIRDLEDTQIAVDKANRKVSTSQEAVRKATDKLNADTIKYGKNSKEVKQDTLDLSQAQQGLSINTKLQGEALERQSDTLQDVATSGFTTLLGVMTTAISGTRDLGLSIKGGIPKIKEWGTSIKSAAANTGGFKGALLGIGVPAFAGLAGGLLILEDVNATMNKLDQVGLKFTRTSSTLWDTKSVDQMKLSTAELDEVLKRTGASLLEFRLAPESVAKRFFEAGGKVDKFGNIVVTTEKKITASSTDLQIAQDKLNKALADPALKSHQTATRQAAEAVVKHWQAEVKRLSAVEATNKVLAETTAITKQLTPITQNLWKTWEVDGGRAAAVAQGFGANINTLKEKFLALSAAQKDLFGTKFTQNVMQFNDLLKNWGGGKLTQTAERSKELAANLKTATQHARDLVTNANNVQPAIEKAKKATEDFKKSLEGATTSLKATFKIDSNVDKIKKQIAKMLPDKVEKKIKLDLKMDQKIDDFKQAFSDFIFEATQLDDKTADSIVKTLIKNIDEKFKGQKGPFAGLETQLKAAMANPNTPQALIDLLKKFDWSTIGPPIVEGAQKGIAKEDPVKIPVQGVWTGFDPQSAGGFEMDLGGGGKKKKNQKNVQSTDDTGISPFMNEFTQFAMQNDYWARVNNARHPPRPEGDNSSKEKKWPISSMNMQSFSNAKPQINIEMALKQIDVLAKRIMGLSSIMPVLTLNNTAAIKAIDVIALRLTSLTKIAPTIMLVNSQAIKAIDVIAKRIIDLTGLAPIISLVNKQAVKAVDVVATRINDLTGIKPQISLQNKQAIKAVDVVAKRIDGLSDIKAKINLSNKDAIKSVDVIAKRIDSLNQTVTVHVKQTGGTISAQKGLHAYLLEDTTIMAHKGERVDIGHGSEGKGGGVTFNNMGGGGGTPSGGDTIINVHVMDETIMRRITARSGKNRFTMGV